MLSFIAQHSTKWGFWFKKIGTRLKFVFICNLLAALTLQDGVFYFAYVSSLIENLTRLGKYTLSLSTLLSESNATDFGGRTLPSYKLNFTIKGQKKCNQASRMS